jgi:hypothetical protein
MTAALFAAGHTAACIGCGCDDMHACYDRGREAGCYWLRLDRKAGKGVCSECEEHVEAWDRGDRTSHAEPAELIENPPRISRPEQPRPAGKPCPHDWPFEDVQDSDQCRWCGMSFVRHVFTECA